MSETISICGPLEMKDGALALIIPLHAGGSALAPLAQKISHIEGDNLIVPIPGWLATKLNVYEGSLVYVDSANGKFTITRSADNPN
jgi:hypothetical protein